MHSLFPMFPRQGAGLALLALRLSVAGSLFGPVATSTISLAGLAAGAVTGLLVLGAFTPAAASVALVLQLAWAAEHEIGWTLVTGTQAACIALLGPGAWSLDAARFGRRTIEWPGNASGDGPDGEDR
jgi:hypothetical protein